MNVNITSPLGQGLHSLRQKFDGDFVASTTALYQQVTWWQWTLTAIIGALTYDQVMYQIRKGSIAGPKYKMWPIIGPFLESLDPKFEEYKDKWNSGALSCVSIFHKFVVIVSSRDLARKVLASHKYVKPCVVDAAFKILRPTNWVFLDGKAHSDYRKSLNGLFSRKALEIYIQVQEQYMDIYLDRFLKIDGPTEFFPLFRELLCAISLRTFCGSHIKEEQIAEIADNYYRITAALELVNFPIIIPYTKTWYGKVLAHKTMLLFEDIAAMSKERINVRGEKPQCVVDEWIYLMKQAKESNLGDSISEEDRALLVREFSNKEISEVIFTFLFASQDASSSLACWLFQIVADRPDVAAKVRQEQLAVRNGDPSVPLSLELIGEMSYTHNVVRETLRYRPPVLMVPYVVKKAFPITDDYTVPKGAMVVPTLYPALHDPEVYPEPDSFIPERWENPTKEMENRNWLPFGTGPHKCLGKNYVLMTFTGLLGKYLMNADLVHHKTKLSEEIKVFATIFPKDDLIMEWHPRDPLKVD